MTEAQLIEGKILAQKIQEEIQTRIPEMLIRGFERPGLLALQASNDPSATWYINQQEKLATKLGIHFEKIGPDRLPDQHSLLKVLEHYRNRSHKFHGIFLAMPFPEGFNVDEILLSMDPKKDVEGVHPASLGLIVLRRAKLIPPTAFAAFKLTEWAVAQAGIELKGLKAAIVGQSTIVGRPVQLLLGERRVTTTVCNTGTSKQDLEKVISDSDIVIACAGQPGLIKGSWVKQGAIVVDVGTTEVNGKLVGDVEFEEAKKRASYITPVPGGVGPLTVTMLMQNLMNAYDWQYESQNQS